MNRHTNFYSRFFCFWSFLSRITNATHVFGTLEYGLVNDRYGDVRSAQDLISNTANNKTIEMIWCAMVGLTCGHFLLGSSYFICDAFARWGLLTEEWRRWELLFLNFIFICHRSSHDNKYSSRPFNNFVCILSTACWHHDHRHRPHFILNYFLTSYSLSFVCVSRVSVGRYKHSFWGSFENVVRISINEILVRTVLGH